MAHCATCRDRRGGAAWRKQISEKYTTATTDWECPLGVPWNTNTNAWLAFRQKHRIGDRVESVTKAVGIKPCGGCKKRKDYLNGKTT